MPTSKAHRLCPGWVPGPQAVSSGQHLARDWSEGAERGHGWSGSPGGETRVPAPLLAGQRLPAWQPHGGRRHQPHVGRMQGGQCQAEARSQPPWHTRRTYCAWVQAAALADGGARGEGMREPPGALPPGQQRGSLPSLTCLWRLRRASALVAPGTKLRARCRLRREGGREVPGEGVQAARSLCFCVLSSRSPDRRPRGWG